MNSRRLIETDEFPFEFLSQLAKRESWRKEIHRPIYHVHKWWAKRLGSVFRGLALGSVLSTTEDLIKEFYQPRGVSDFVVFDPFMGSGTTIGEAHKLGFTSLGRDINPVAVEAVRVAMGTLNSDLLEDTFAELSRSVGAEIQRLYRSEDSKGRLCQVLYHFWVMQVDCPSCSQAVDLFPSWIRARNADPRRKPEVQILCPCCGDFFEGLYGQRIAVCPSCEEQFDPKGGPAVRASATCRECDKTFAIRQALKSTGCPPAFRLYGKLVLTKEGGKEYLRATDVDDEAYERCSEMLAGELQRESFVLPLLELTDGHNTKQAMSYGFIRWRDFFNDRQLLALGWLHEAISALPREKGRDAFLTLFSGALEFNNMFASYKGEGTGAVRHMFSHHILKPERTPIEANLWGTPRSSGSFSGLFRSRLLKAARYQKAPTELGGATNGKQAVVCSFEFSGLVESEWGLSGALKPRGIYLSCGDSASTHLPERTVDLILTDPPFFDNVHYSELADFFFAWQQLVTRGAAVLTGSTRSANEVQDTGAAEFAAKLESVLAECHRVLKDEGLLVFTYHHSREEGWTSVAAAILGAGFTVVNAHPLKSEMSVATPKAQAREPIQLDIAIVCRKTRATREENPTYGDLLESGKAKIARLEAAGFTLSRNDKKVILFGQLLIALRSTSQWDGLVVTVEQELMSVEVTESSVDQAAEH